MFLKIFKKDIVEALNRVSTIVTEKSLEMVRDRSGRFFVRKISNCRCGLKLINNQCLGILRKIEPSLIREYKGAAYAVEGRNSDKTRHVFVSLRTMWEQILNALAPVQLSLS